MGLCFSFPNKVQERRCPWLTVRCRLSWCPSTCGTYLWLSIDVTVCMLLFLQWSCARSPPSDAYRCNLWIVATADKNAAFNISALPLALALMRPLQTLSNSDQTSLNTKRSKRMLSCHGSTR